MRQNLCLIVDQAQAAEINVTAQITEEAEHTHGPDNGKRQQQDKAKAAEQRDEIVEIDQPFVVFRA